MSRRLRKRFRRNLRRSMDARRIDIPKMVAANAMTANSVGL
jgi:hypothetical protein